MKYGWEIADEIQRWVGNTADMQFIEYTEYYKLKNENELLEDHLLEESEAHKRMAAMYFEMREALELLVLDVQDYESWQRPCRALDRAKEILNRQST
jgi:hypothetical protein